MKGSCIVSYSKDQTKWLNRLVQQVINITWSSQKFFFFLSLETTGLGWSPKLTNPEHGYWLPEVGVGWLIETLESKPHHTSPSSGYARYMEQSMAFQRGWGDSSEMKGNTVLSSSVCTNKREGWEERPLIPPFHSSKTASNRHRYHFQISTITPPLIDRTIFY